MNKELTYYMLAPQLQFIYINVFHTILCFLIRDCKLLEFKKIIRRLIRKSAMLAFVTPRNIFFFFTSTWNVIGLNCEYFFCCFVFQFIFNYTHTYLNNSSKNKRLLLKIAVSCSLSISQNICVLLLLESPPPDRFHDLLSSFYGSWEPLFLAYIHHTRSTASTNPLFFRKFYLMKWVRT